MDPVTVGALITAAIPFITAAIKRIFKTKEILADESTRAGVHALIPVVLGVLTTGVYTYTETHDWKVSLAVGLGSGGAASSARDIDKNLTGIVEYFYKVNANGEPGK